MSVRDFDGVDDIIKLAAPAYFGGAFTIVAVVNRDTTNSWDGIFSIGPSDASHNPDLVFELSDDARIEYVADHALTHVRESVHNWATTGWQLVAVTINVGTAFQRFHGFDGATWFHGPGFFSSGNTDLTPTDWTLDGKGELRFGNWDANFNFFDGKMAVEALWVGSALSDAQVEALAGGNAASWASAGAAHLWELNQASVSDPVTDYIGTLDQTAIFGTSVVIGNDPPSAIFSFTPTGYATTAEVVAASKRQPLIVGKQSNVAYGNGGPFADLWLTRDLSTDVGGPWPAGAVPAATPGETLSLNTIGAIPLPSAPLSGKDHYLLRARVRSGAFTGSPGKLLLLDRLVQAGGLVANIATTQSVNTVALPRFTNGEGVGIAVAQYATATLLTTTTVAANYTNEQGVSGRTAGPVPWPNNTGSSNDVVILSLDTGDYGVRSVESLTFTNPSGAAGSVAVVLFKPICWLQVGIDNASAGSYRFGDWSKDWRFLAMPKVAPDACLNVWTDAFSNAAGSFGFLVDLLFGDA